MGTSTYCTISDCLYRKEPFAMSTADVEKGSSGGAYYGTFEGQSSMPQPSAPPIPGTDFQAVPGAQLNCLSTILFVLICHGFSFLM